MHHDDERNEVDENHPSSSHRGAPEREAETIEEEIGDLLDELTQEGGEQ